MTMPRQPALLIIVRHTPYGSSLAQVALDVALACAAFEQKIRLLFMGEGVLQLTQEQQPREIGARSIARQLASLPLYDIDQVFVDQNAASFYRLDLPSSPLKLAMVDAQGIHKLMTQHDHLLSF